MIFFLLLMALLYPVEIRQIIKGALINIGTTYRFSLFSTINFRFFKKISNFKLKAFLVNFDKQNGELILKTQRHQDFDKLEIF